MANWRSVLVKLKILWSYLCQSVQPYFNCDYDRCMYLIMIGAGIRPLPGTDPWKRRCLILNRLLGFYQFMMTIAKVGFSIWNGNDTLGLSVSIALLGAHTATYAKIYILGFYDENVRQSKNLVNSKFSFSGDPDYDAMVRRCYATVPGKVALTIIVIFCCDQVILSIPNAARDSLYGIPEQFHNLGIVAAHLLQEMYVSMFAIIWGCGYFFSPLTIMPLLNGLKNELMIINRGYELIAERRFTQSLEDQLNIKHSKQMLGVTVEQHIEVLRIIHLVQPVVNLVYAMTYYSVIINIGMLAFVVIRSEITLVTLMVLGASCLLAAVECYLWCRMVESIEKTIETTVDCAAPLGFGLPHSVDNHSEYIAMRTSIMIIQLNASQCNWFSCGGIFPISVESFGNLCMIIYKFVTFMLEFD